MSCNIYEEPSISMREGNKDRMERLVGIYESFDADRRHGRLTPPRGTSACSAPPGHRAALLVLGLLCLLLLVGISVMSYFFLQNLNHSRIQDHLTRTRTEGVCPTGWTRYRCKCYNLSTEEKTWNDSRTDCEGGGAQLVTIKNKEEHAFVMKLGKHEAFWIGLESMISMPVRWTWVDGTQAEYKPFRKGTNVNYGIKSYVYMDPAGHWVSVQDGTRLWMCEKPLSEDQDQDRTAH